MNKTTSKILNSSKNATKTVWRSFKSLSAYIILAYFLINYLQWQEDYSWLKGRNNYIKDEVKKLNSIQDSLLNAYENNDHSFCKDHRAPFFVLANDGFIPCPNCDSLCRELERYNEIAREISDWEQESVENDGLLSFMKTYYGFTRYIFGTDYDRYRKWHINEYKRQH